MTTTADKIAAECDAVRALLLEKNKAYGDSALDPLRVFSQADAAEQLRVRIDDKLSRIKRGQAIGEDTVTDLIGYLVLYKIATRAESATASVATPVLPRGCEWALLFPDVVGIEKNVGLVSYTAYIDEDTGQPVGSLLEIHPEIADALLRGAGR